MPRARPSAIARQARTVSWLVNALVDATPISGPASSVSDTDPIVRGLTFRALTDHHGAKFQPILAKAATADPDPWAGWRGGGCGPPSPPWPRGGAQPDRSQDP